MKPALKPKAYQPSVTPVKRVLITSAAFGAAMSAVFYASLTTADAFYARQAQSTQEQIAFGKRIAPSF